MDANINHILEPNEQVVWQGVVSRNVIVSGLIISLTITFIIGGILFSQDMIKLTSESSVTQVSGRLAGVAVMLIGLAISLVTFLSDIVKQYAITQKRVIIKSGIIGTDFKSIYFDQIKNIIVDVGLIGKIFHVGSLKVDIGKTDTYSTGENQVRTRTMYDMLKHISTPYEAYKHFQKTLETRKESLYSGRADKESNPESYK